MSRTSQILLFIYIASAVIIAAGFASSGVRAGAGEVVISSVLLISGLGSCVLTLYYFLYFLITRTKGDILLVNAAAATVFIIFFTVLLNTIHC